MAKNSEKPFVLGELVLDRQSNRVARVTAITSTHVTWSSPDHFGVPNTDSLSGAPIDHLAPHEGDVVLVQGVVAEVNGRSVLISFGGNGDGDRWMAHTKPIVVQRNVLDQIRHLLEPGKPETISDTVILGRIKTMLSFLPAAPPEE